MKNSVMQRLLAGGLTWAMALSLASCVNQHPDEDALQSEAQQSETRLIATSGAAMDICDRLDLDLIAIPTTTGEIPQRYQGLPEIGTPMSPDAEAIALLEPTDVIGPDTLRETIEPTYEAAGIPCTWLDLQSIPGMYESIATLGETYGRQTQAEALISEYEDIMAGFEAAVAGQERPTVLVLMGLPGSYIECTPNSYVGSLVELAGAANVVQVEDEMNFVSWNTEELLALDPDVILLTAHGMPDLAMEMFAEEFTTNDVWKHFRAVQEGRVYQLDYATFGMSCDFNWPQALDTLRQILYDGTYSAYDAEGAYLENHA